MMQVSAMHLSNIIIYMYDAWIHDACIHNSFIYMILDPGACVYDAGMKDAYICDL